MTRQNFLKSLAAIATITAIKPFDLFVDKKFIPLKTIVMPPMESKIYNVNGKWIVANDPYLFEKTQHAICFSKPSGELWDWDIDKAKKLWRESEYENNTETGLYRWM